MTMTFINLGTIQRHYGKYILERNKIDCPTGIPCVYESLVDLRIIVLTFDRNQSVMKLLNSLQSLELDGDEAVLEIWIDRNAKGQIDNATYKAVSEFKWSKGACRVHNQSKPAGILGQWIDTWRPRGAPPHEWKNMTATMYEYKPEYYRELALILEDDMTVSPQAYRFLKAVHRKYGGRPDYAGVTLTSDEVYAHNNRKALIGPQNDTAFMYVCIGTWGFSPSPQYWAEFQDWYHYARNKTGFWPLLPGAEPSNWFSGFIPKGTADHMWEMWFIYFANKKKAYTVYSNLNRFNGGKPKSCVGFNRREVGLHYHSKGAENLCELLKTWDPMYESRLPDNPIKLDWFGNVVLNYTTTTTTTTQKTTTAKATTSVTRPTTSVTAATTTAVGVKRLKDLLDKLKSWSGG